MGVQTYEFVTVANRWVDVSRGDRADFGGGQIPSSRHADPAGSKPLGVDSIDPEAEGDDETDGDEEVASELVIASCNPSEVFEAAEASLDDVAQPVEFRHRRGRALCD